MTTVVLQGGRVVDPGNGLDEVTDVLIAGGRIAAVGPELDGDATIDVTGLVVGPGFIDLHSHTHSILGHRVQAHDGVTTALDLEAGVLPVAVAYERAAAEGRPLNFGFSASWSQARGQILAGVTATGGFHEGLALVGIDQWQMDSTSTQLDAWLGILRGELADGALGIGILMGYAPRNDPAEMVAVARLAAEAGVGTFTHVREIIESDPTTPVDGSSELGIVAAETGAAMHHCHVNSTSRRHIDRVLTTIAAAQAAGSAVTVEAYPYGAGSTGIGAYFLAPERLDNWDISPSSIVVVATGERIADAARLRELRAQDPAELVIVEFLDERAPIDRALLEASLAFPDTIIASDAMPIVLPGGALDTLEWPPPPGASTHPRTSGTYLRSLRLMVGSGAWTWSEAFRRCSWLPAQVLAFAPAARRKGHLGVGADADIVVLDPADLTDRATYSEPMLLSRGVRHLFVNGTAVIRGGQLDLEASPGRALRADPR